MNTASTAEVNLKMLISLSDLDLSFLGKLCCKCGMVEIYDNFEKLSNFYDGRNFKDNESRRI